uniref:Ubiquitin carboxyl-terminal hydrolase n=1 Tax=Paramormyrops kingsleyae TaxID=1676925 RepID=A0A3B3R350_9TELE
MADPRSVADADPTGGDVQNSKQEVVVTQEVLQEDASVPPSSAAEGDQEQETVNGKGPTGSISSGGSEHKCEGSDRYRESEADSANIEEKEKSDVTSRSDEQSQSGDSASFSLPSLDFSEGNNEVSLDEPLSSSYSAIGAEGQSPPADGPGLPEDAAIGTASGTIGATAPLGPELITPAYYFVKWIDWKGKRTPIVTQSENGPCPLLAIMNILFLRWKNMSDAMAVLPKLSTGLDVNVRFTGVSDFEYTPECIVFDLLDIPLYHGWLVDPQSPEMVAAVGKLSYNQLVEKIIDYKHSPDSSRISEGLMAEQFLESTATQLSYHGLCELNTTAKEGELSVFFRNNHFSTMIKHKGHLYLLVTDQGFLQEETVVWESLHNVEGDGNFCDSEFRLCHPPQRAAPLVAPTPSPQQQQRQIDQDYLVAMSLQQQQGAPPGPLSDLELAQQLQQEEYQQQQQQQQLSPGQPTAPQVRGQAAAQQGSQRRRAEKKEGSDCAII